METADLLICEVKPYISSFEKRFVTLYENKPYTIFAKRLTLYNF